MKWTLHIPITLTTANARVVNGAHAATAAIYRRHRDACALALTVAARNAGVSTFDGTGRFRWVRLVRLYTLVELVRAKRGPPYQPAIWRRIDRKEQAA